MRRPLIVTFFNGLHKTFLSGDLSHGFAVLVEQTLEGFPGRIKARRIEPELGHRLGDRRTLREAPDLDGFHDQIAHELRHGIAERRLVTQPFAGFAVDQAARNKLTMEVEIALILPQGAKAAQRGEEPDGIERQLRFMD